ncbi:MAG: glycosyltransferase family 2 protein [Clostridia bacterium]|nr:glycosyltransferase family 2 protein [Clostridia bacterium]
MWYEVLYRVLSIINYVVLIIIAIPLLWQVIIVLLSWLPKRTYERSEVKGRIAFFIPAHNEEDVIYDTVKSIIEKQNYPRELFDVLVVADNCTDRTAELAEKAGAIVLIHNDPDPAHQMAAYPVKFAIDHIMAIEDNPYDMVIRVDADNHLNDDFALYMNDAFQSGVDYARPYEGAMNATQNFYTKACAIFYAFDSRFGARVRERLHIGQHVNGPGAMMSMRMLKATGGFECTSMAEDTEYMIKMLEKGYKGHFVEDAVVYEDMPSSSRDTYNRNLRIGSGGAKLLKSDIWRLFGKFFITGNFSYLDVFLTYGFVFLSVLAWWLPVYYVYDFIFVSFCAYGKLAVTMFAAQYYMDTLWYTVIVLGSILVALFVLFGWVQALILVVSDYRKMNSKNRRSLASVVLAFPVFLIFYSATVSFGAMSKPKWRKVSRNKTNLTDQTDQTDQENQTDQTDQN